MYFTILNIIFLSPGPVLHGSDPADLPPPRDRQGGGIPAGGSHRLVPASIPPPTPSRLRRWWQQTHGAATRGADAVLST